MTTLSVPLAWSATVRASSGAQMERKYREVRSVEIADVNPSDLRACISWAGRAPARAEIAQGDAPQVVLLAHRDDLYEPVRTTRYVNGRNFDGEWRVVPVSVAELSKALEGGFGREGGLHSDPSLVLGLATTKEAETVRLAPPKKVDIVYGQENRQRAYKEVDGLADRFIVVDGMLHAKAREPVLVACPDVPCVRIADPMDLNGPDRMRAYPLTDIDAAVEHAARVSGKPAASVGLPNYRLMDGTVLRQDAGILRNAIWEAVRTVDAAGAKSVPRLDVAGVSLFCDLQELRNPGRGSEPDMDALATCVASLARAIADSGSYYAKDSLEPSMVAERWMARAVPDALPRP